MSTTTTKLGLVKPATSDLVNIADLTDNFSAIDTNINAQVVTSGTHPSNPWVGKLIYETDTDFIRIWTGTSWDAIASNKWGRGFVAESVFTTNTATTSGTTELDTGWEVTFTADNTRKYMLNFSGLGELTTDDATNGGHVQVRYRYAAGASVTTAGTLIGANPSFIDFINLNTVRTFNDWRTFTPVSSGQTTVGIFLIGAASHAFQLDGSVANSRSTLTIYDVGSA